MYSKTTRVKNSAAISAAAYGSGFRTTAHVPPPVFAQREPREAAAQKQESAEGGDSVAPDTAADIESNKGGGHPLPYATRSFMESRFGTNFSEVRIHNNPEAAALSTRLSAQAFTTGKDIFFNSGKYAPETAEGTRLLAHELTHTVQQSGSGLLQRVPMPANTAVADLESYSAGTRQNIRYDNSFNLRSNQSLFFQERILTDVRAGFNVTYVVRGFPATETWLENPMRAMALYTFNLNRSATEEAATGVTTVQHLDLSAQTKPTDATQHGPNALIRFTSTAFDSTTADGVTTRNVQLMIEKQSDFTAAAATESAAQRATRYASTYQIVNAQPVNNDPLADLSLTIMSDAQFDQVLIALDHVSPAVLSRATGIPIYRGDTARGGNGEIAEYRQSKPPGATVWQRRITAYRDFFSTTLEQQAMTLAHEFGHALDSRPNETATGTGGASLSAVGERDQTSFRYAIQQDGGLSKGISEYEATKTSFDEYFAEAFALYVNQRLTLRALRPNVFQYFARLYP